MIESMVKVSRVDRTGVARILVVAGARPNFMKVAPLMAAFHDHTAFNVSLVHTGQHYDQQMSDVFFEDLGLAPPEFSLGVGSGTHAEQTAAVLTGFEKLCMQQEPDLVIVVGDVNSTLACALAARKLDVPVAHIEAGLRSRNWTMPEETNRVITDVISDYLFTPSVDADVNLRGEGIASGRVHLVGNVMIDSLVRALAALDAGRPATDVGVDGDFGLLTLHRPSNVDDMKHFRELLDALASLGVPLIFPVHPRTAKQITVSLGRRGSLKLIDPLGYYDFVGLMRKAAFVVTDSGGIQEETTYLGVPCLTLRPQTERPITIDRGTNELATLDSLPEQVRTILDGGWKKGEVPELWDGQAAKRIVAVLEKGIERRLI